MNALVLKIVYLRKAFINMAKILITGNGFDLFHHLPTKYQHFMSVMKTIENNKFNEEVSFDDLFGLEFKIDSKYDYNAIIDNYLLENILFNHEKLNGIKEMLKDNLWYKYFSKVLEIDTWIDFELEIENILNQLIIFDKFKNKKDIKKNMFSDEFIGFTDFELFNIISIINYSGGFKINDKYINHRNSSIDIKQILNDLAKSFEDFIIIFNRYLIDVVSVFYAEIKQSKSLPFHLLNEIYTFNYTPSLEKIYKVEKSKVVYLHGKINEANNIQNLVLGISEMPKDIKTSKMFDFTKYYQRIKKNSNRKFIEIPTNKKSGLDETIFYIIGHSLDESDKEYIADLFKFLEFDLTAYSKICVFYHSAHDREHKLKNLLSVIDKNVIVEMNKIGRLYFVELSIKNIEEEFRKDLKSGDGWR
jgi:hypothetical protein